MTFETVAAALAGAALFYLGVRLRSQQGPRRRPPGPGTGPPESPLRDPFLSRLYAAHQRMDEAPRVSTPEELLELRPFMDLVELLTPPEIDSSVLLRYFEGNDLVLACASLVALSKRSTDPDTAKRVLVRLNRFHAWTRHFQLRALEAWRPDDPRLAGDVLVRLDESWQTPEAARVLEGFLRRRAVVAPVALDAVDRPEGFDTETLREILNSLDPDLARPIADELGPAPRRTAWGMPGWPGEVASLVLEDLGRVCWPGKAKADEVIPYASADERLERVVATLELPPARSVLVVGEPGVGKSSLIKRTSAGLSGKGWAIFEAGAAQINAGMSFVGMLEARIQQLGRLLAQQPPALWVVPDFQQLLWSGRATGHPIGILELILPMVEAGEIRILGEIRPAALERVLLERPEVARLFEIVRIEPPTAAEVTVLLDAWASATQGRRGVRVPAALQAEAQSLARQYLSAEMAPGGVLRLLERAVLIASRRAAPPRPADVTMDDLVDALVQLTGLPADILDDRRSLDLDAVRRQFESRVIGQTEAVDCLVERLALIKAGVTDPTRPYGVFLFAGGTGTGKTELAKALAEYLFGSVERLLRLDMSELQDSSAMERLLGSQATALGVGNSNSLAEQVRRQPFCVALLDEFEKAHGRVWDVFLQVFDDGRLTDHRGETVDFRHAIIILTSNLTGGSAQDVRLGLVGDPDQFSPTAVERAVARTFKPELFNRLDRVLVFRPLTMEIMRRILRKELAEAFERRGLRRREWAVEIEDSAFDLLVERGFSPALGARPLKRAVERLLLAPLARAIVDRTTPEGDQFLFVRAAGDRLEVEFVDPDAPAVEAAPAAAPADLAAIVYEPRGGQAEVEQLGASLDRLRAHVESATWREAKQALLLEPASPGFWERPDRFDRLGRAEYLDRIESSLRSATSLLERLRGDPQSPRVAYQRTLVRRLAQQLFLIEAASREALECGPRDAFLTVAAMGEGDASASHASEFALKLAAMYEAWARKRGMRWATLGTTGGALTFGCSGFAAYALLAPEDGLHVLERETPRGAQRDSVRVRVVAQPTRPARDEAELRSQAREALSALGPASPTVVRRYREGASPLVRDAVRGWRTGRVERVFSGDFDVIPAGEK